MREMMAGMSRVYRRQMWLEMDIEKPAFRSDSVAPILEGSSFVAAFGAG